MEPSFYVRLIDRNEAVEYRDENGVHAFDLRKKGREWTIYLPDSPDMTADRERQVIERTTKYLSRIWWFGVFPFRYTVRVERKNGLS
jgi:hypothetical protein